MFDYAAALEKNSKGVLATQDGQGVRTRVALGGFWVYIVMGRDEVLYAGYSTDIHPGYHCQAHL